MFGDKLGNSDWTTMDFSPSLTDWDTQGDALLISRRKGNCSEVWKAGPDLAENCPNEKQECDLRRKKLVKQAHSKRDRQVQKAEVLKPKQPESDFGRCPAQSVLVHLCSTIENFLFERGRKRTFWFGSWRGKNYLTCPYSSGWFWPLLL